MTLRRPLPLDDGTVPSARARRSSGVFVAAALACTSGGCDASPTTTPVSVTLLPTPDVVTFDRGTFRLGASARLAFARSGIDATAEAAMAEELERFAASLRASTGFALPVIDAPARPGDLELRIDGARSAEAYGLDVRPGRVTIEASSPAGLYYATRTLLLAAPIAHAVASPSPEPFAVPAMRIEDAPRFAYRGLMLDVARHFFSVEEVERLIARMAAFKLNHLHLHLSDDQGFRLEIPSYPALVTVGAATEVGGGAGGAYSLADYARIQATAALHHVVIVPEIDVPGHSNAMLASIAALNCDGTTTAPYTGTMVGFSSVCTSGTTALDIVRDILGTVAGETTGPYLHVGGDESAATPPTEYAAFVRAVLDHVRSLGKTPIGWDEIGDITLPPGTVAQHWLHPTSTRAAADQGASILLSPAQHVYLDMRYDLFTPIGQAYLGFVDVDRSYSWDPASFVDGVPESAILGIEAPLWTEFVATEEDVEAMVFPRALGVAERAWAGSPLALDPYLAAVASMAGRLEALGIGYYPSVAVPWTTP